MQNIYPSSRLHPVYKSFRDNVRNGQMWGHIPENEGVFTFFENISKYIDVKNILEFGYNLGFSSSYQLVVHPNATLTSYDPTIWHTDSALKGYHPEYEIPFKIPAWTLGKLAFGDRLNFINEPSNNVLINHKTGDFDYCLIDGDHTTQGTINDIKNCIELEIPYLCIDNCKNIPQVVNAIGAFDNLREVECFEYAANYPLLHKDTGQIQVVTDQIKLFEVL